MLRTKGFLIEFAWVFSCSTCQYLRAVMTRNDRLRALFRSSKPNGLRLGRGGIGRTEVRHRATAPITFRHTVLVSDILSVFDSSVLLLLFYGGRLIPHKVLNRVF